MYNMYRERRRPLPPPPTLPYYLAPPPPRKPRMDAPKESALGCLLLYFVGVVLAVILWEIFWRH